MGSDDMQGNTFVRILDLMVRPQIDINTDVKNVIEQMQPYLNRKGNDELLSGVDKIGFSSEKEMNEFLLSRFRNILAKSYFGINDTDDGKEGDDDDDEEGDDDDDEEGDDDDDSYGLAWRDHGR